MIAEELVKVKATVTAQGEDTANLRPGSRYLRQDVTELPEYPEFLTLPLYEAMA